MRDDLRRVLADTRPGLVPTMGALHAGHRSLIERSAAENHLTVVSIFVNPKQFGDAHDLARYPRDIERDVAFAVENGAGLIFAPEAGEVYPLSFDTTVEAGHLGQLWEGASRPGHFCGVATVVTILLNLVRPARAYFGEKDFQQLQIVRRLHKDLALPGEVVGCPTVRDDDGLAHSSRNERLSAADRARALAIPRAINAVLDAAANGEERPATLEAAGRVVLGNSGLSSDYIAIVDGESLLPIQELQAGARVLIAADVGGVRLIDNAEIVSGSAGAR